MLHAIVADQFFTKVAKLWLKLTPLTTLGQGSYWLWRALVFHVLNKQMTEKFLSSQWTNQGYNRQLLTGKEISGTNSLVIKTRSSFSRTKLRSSIVWAEVKLSHRLRLLSLGLLVTMTTEVSLKRKQEPVVERERENFLSFRRQATFRWAKK